jgi:prophage regulatory protein
MNTFDEPTARTLSDTELKTPGKVLINRKHLLQKVPLCERTILDMEKRGEFPRRFAITSRLVAWDLSEVDAWIVQRQVEAAPSPRPGTEKR